MNNLIYVHTTKAQVNPKKNPESYIISFTCFFFSWRWGFNVTLLLPGKGTEAETLRMMSSKERHTFILTLSFIYSLL